MKHDFHDREDGLLHCRVCDGAEASLPDECPGRRMTVEEQDEVQERLLQFSNGKWWSPTLAAVAPRTK